jgi:DNA-binding CsgD family transcriptional regulator/PAS domain-containing protein
MQAQIASMGRESQYLQAVYDAALSDEHWPRALAALSDQIPCVGTLLMAIDQVGLPFRIDQASSAYRPEDVRDYLENFAHYDNANIEATTHVPPMRLVRDCDVSGNIGALEDRPDYIWMRENIGARRKAGVRLSHGKGWFDVMAFQFADEWSGPADALQAQLDTLLPHVAKVVEVNRKFAILRHQYRAVLAALDHVRIGTCITGPNGHVIVSNREAQRIFSLGDGIGLSRLGFLTGATSEATAELAAKVRAVSSTARGEGSDHENVVFAARGSGARPFLVEIAPLRDSVGELERGLSGALVFIVDPDNQRSVSTQRLCLLFGLTEAEAEICRHMVGGLSAAEIASERDVSEDTVKSQFKAVYAKTGVRRRADLVRLALAVDPPIGLPGDG